MVNIDILLPIIEHRLREYDGRLTFRYASTTVHVYYDKRLCNVMFVERRTFSPLSEMKDRLSDAFYDDVMDEVLNGE